MPEHLLDVAERHAAAQLVRGEGVTERVRRDLHAPADGPGVALEDEPEPLPGYAAAARVDEERSLGVAACEERSRRLEVIDERFVAAAGEGHVA